MSGWGPHPAALGGGFHLDSVYWVTTALSGYTWDWGVYGVWCSVQSTEQMDNIQMGDLNAEWETRGDEQ